MRDEVRRTLLAGHAPGGEASWQQRVGGWTRLPALVKALGADPGPWLADAGLAPDALEAPGHNIPFASGANGFL